MNFCPECGREMAMIEDRYCDGSDTHKVVMTNCEFTGCTFPPKRTTYRLDMGGEWKVTDG